MHLLWDMAGTHWHSKFIETHSNFSYMKCKGLNQNRVHEVTDIEASRRKILITSVCTCWVNQPYT